MSENLEQNIIYWHPHPDHEKVKNANKIHKERNIASINKKFAVYLTKHVGSMWTAYLFVILACVGLASILGYLPEVVVILVTWLSQTFIQLVLLPVIMVGQNVLNEHSEAQAEVTFENTKESLQQEKHSIEHLNAQDQELLQQTELLKRMISIVLTQNEKIIQIQEEQSKIQAQFSKLLEDRESGESKVKEKEQQIKRVYRRRGSIDRGSKIDNDE